MVNCNRCFLKLSVRTVNLVLIFCGFGMIIYSLWLLKMWAEGFAQITSVSPSPTPGFVYTCISVGIVVCLSMLSGHAVVHCIGLRIFCIYMVSIVVVLVLEVGLIVVTFFKMDWQSEISTYIGQKDDDFENFLYLHLLVCRLLSIIILVAQVNAFMLIVILWALGPVPRNHCDPPEQPEFKQSFLVRSDSPVHPMVTEQC